MSKIPIWSWSASRDFQRCPRQWYFKSIVANALAKDHLRQEAHRLSQLKSISAWRGSLVDTVIGDKLIPAIKNHQVVNFTEIIGHARLVFEQQWRLATQPPTKDDAYHPFYAVEYGLEITPEERERAWTEVEQALSNLSRMSDLLNLLRQALHLVDQRPLVYAFDDATVRAVPDLIAFFYNAPPLIVDWKVSIFGERDYRFQLGTYALALKRCQPHADFPASLAHYSNVDIRLLEAQLLSGLTREYTLTEADFADIDEYIFQSIMQMKLALGEADTDGQLRPFDFPVTSYPDVCERCNYRSLCWQEKKLWDEWKQMSFL